jgi:hypothetical protein
MEDGLHDKLAAAMIELQQKRDDPEQKQRDIDDLVLDHQRIVEGQCEETALFTLAQPISDGHNPSWQQESYPRNSSSTNRAGAFVPRPHRTPSCSQTSTTMTLSPPKPTTFAPTSSNLD